MNLPEWSTFWWHTIRVGLGLSLKSWTRLKDGHPSLFVRSVSEEGKKFYNIDPIKLKMLNIFLILMFVNETNL